MERTEDTDTICEKLVDLQVRRKFLIKLETALTNQTKALVARMCGFDSLRGDDAATRKKIWARAGRITGRVFAGKAQTEEDQEVYTILAADLEMAHQMLFPLTGGRVPVEKKGKTKMVRMLGRRGEVEAEMKWCARLLPAATIIDATPGFDALGLAVIVGEAGNLSNYPGRYPDWHDLAGQQRPAKHARGCLWRRFGLATDTGHEDKAYSTWRREGGLSAADWTDAGYVPSRLGQLYGVVTTPLFLAKSKNKYGAAYAARCARTMVTHPEWWLDEKGAPKVSPTGEPSSKHAMEDAKRVMVKKFLADLLREWRRTNVRLAEKPTHHVSAADQHRDAA